MALTDGNYIIRSAIDENYVLLTSAGSKSKGATVTCGALTEEDNRCYWKCAVEYTSYNKFYNINTGSGNGYIMAATVAADKGITQGGFNRNTGAWLATLSGNTMIVNGVSVNTYFLTAYGNSSLYLTVPDNGGDLYLSTVLNDTSPQEFYLEATTYVNTKLATPNNLTTADGLTYIIHPNGNASSFYPMWNSSSTSTIYEMRSRSRRYDMDGVPGDWGSWNDWTMITAAKESAGVMKSGTSVFAPAVDNSSYLQADIQVEARLTSAANAGAYNKTGSVTHGPAVSGIINKWRVPTLSITGAECTRYGLSISYSNTYTLAGNAVWVLTVKDGITELISNCVLTNRDYQGAVVIPWDYLEAIPAENDSLDISMKIIENNGYVSATATATVTVTYDSEEGFSFTPTYTLTNRMTLEAKLPAYDSIECYIKRTDLRGGEMWIPCEEIASANASYRIFEVVPAFGSAPSLRWIVTHDPGTGTQWGYKEETVSAGNMSTLSYVWNWVDDDMTPHAFILKYREGNIVQPGDAMTLSASKFVTMGRDYPIFRYGKSVDRVLDIEGAILNKENDSNATRADAELLATAQHTVYRQPNGKWYQAAIKSVSFTREMSHYNVSVTQEAETR